MPQVTSIVSGMASLGVFAGVISGIFYLVLSGIRWAGRVRAALKEEETRKQLSSAVGRCVSCGRVLTAASDPVVCCLCGSRACLDLPCSKPTQAGWNCVLCYVKSSGESPSSDGTDVKSGDERRSSSNGKHIAIGNETVQVREFIEKIVENIMGGSLDGVPVGKLSQHPSYVEFFGNNHEGLCQAVASLGSSLHQSLSSSSKPPETASSAHIALKLLIEKIAEEAARLPNLSAPSTVHTSPASLTPVHDKSYEDILSTAILNKIISQQQRCYDTGETKRASETRHLNGVKRNTRIYQRQDAHDNGDEAASWSDDSRTDHEIDPLALKIEEQIEEVTTTYGTSDESDLEEAMSSSSRRVPFPEYGVDIVDDLDEENLSESGSFGTDVISNPSTWEENWLFQRKKLKLRNGNNPVPVPMLVPNPSQEFRALIGGVDADDISDLSECSDSVLEEALSEVGDDPCKTLQLVEALNNCEVKEDNILPAESLSRLEPLKEGAHDSEDITVEDQKAPEMQISSSAEETSEPSLEVREEFQPSSLCEKDRDIAVDYDSACQVDQIPVPRPRTLDVLNKAEKTDQDESNPTVCPIAQREKAKWNNAVEMKNNPYTTENIAKREIERRKLYLNGTSSKESVDYPAEFSKLEDFSTPERKYSRDYYIKASRSPTGEQPPRTSDSPLSVRSETSMEDEHPKDLHKWEVWEDFSKAPEVKPRDSQTSEVVPSGTVNDLKKNFLASKPPIPTRTVRKSNVPTPKPVSQIIETLSNFAQEHHEPKNKQEEIFKEIENIRVAKENDRKEVEKDITRNQEIGNSKSEDKRKEEIEDDTLQRNVKRETKDQAASSQNQDFELKQKTRKPIKPVHSLTARSIPKDFREGLKMAKNVKNIQNERIAEVRSGESEQRSLQKLNFDVQGKKKFWENISKMKN